MKSDKNMKQTLLVVIAHPDDESFPMGGTLAKYAAEGVRVILVSATRGEAGIPGNDASTTALIREEELSSAAQTLGIARLLFLDYEDGKLNQIDIEEAVLKIEKIIQEEKPDAIITFGSDGISGHPDHIAVYRFTTISYNRSGSKGRLYYMLPSEATQQGCGIPPSDDVVKGPVASIDITDYRIKKVQAMQCHTSQNPPFPGSPAEEAEKLTCHEYFILAQQNEKSAQINGLFDERI